MELAYPSLMERLMLSELRESLIYLLALEESGEPDWAQISEKSDKIILELLDECSENLVNEKIYHYLEDYGIRMQSSRAAKKQRDGLRKLLRITESR